MIGLAVLAIVAFPFINYWLRSSSLVSQDAYRLQALYLAENTLEEIEQMANRLETDLSELEDLLLGEGFSKEEEEFLKREDGFDLTVRLSDYQTEADNDIAANQLYQIKVIVSWDNQQDLELTSLVAKLNFD